MKIYSKLISKIPYKTLMIIPVVISILMLGVIAINGFVLSFDFSGGLSGELDHDLSQNQIDEIHNALIKANLENLRFRSDGKITTITTTSNERDKIVEIVKHVVNDVRTKDIFTLTTYNKISYDTKEKLNKRFAGMINISEYSNITKIIIVGNRLDEESLKKSLSGYLKFSDNDYKFEKANFKIEEMSSILGANIRTQAIVASVLAFILVTIVIFISFRTFIPSIAIIAAASADVIFAAGCMSIFRIELNSATIIALVMLIGYSVDTDILLTTRVLKRRMFPNEAIDDAMLTGLTMTTAAIIAVFMLMIVGIYGNINALKDLANVLIFGLTMDLMSTWLMNTGILKWYVEEYLTKKKTKKSRFKSKFKFPSLFHE